MINIVSAVVISAASLTSTAGGFGWVCPTLEKNPTEAGVWQVIYQSAANGHTSDSDAQQIISQVVNNCPEYIPLLKRWADHNG